MARIELVSPLLQVPSGCGYVDVVVGEGGGYLLTISSGLRTADDISVRLPVAYHTTSLMMSAMSLAVIILAVLAVPTGIS